MPLAHITHSLLPPCLFMLQDKTLSVVGNKGTTLEAGQTLNDELKRLFSSLQ